MELQPFCTFSASVLKPEFAADTPAGRRVIVGIADAHFTGDGFAASQIGTAATDWLLTGPDGTELPDGRLTLVTDDGAGKFVQYQGRADWPAGRGTGPVYIAVTSETADERYLWMNGLCQ
jgi:hypothetical protein